MTQTQPFSAKEPLVLLGSEPGTPRQRGWERSGRNQRSFVEKVMSNWAWKDEQECSKWERRGRASPAGNMTCPRSMHVSEVFRREYGVCVPADAAMRDSME